MNKNVFSAGVVPGGLKDKQEIKILICFILDKIGHSFKKSDLTSIIQMQSLANYFEVSQAFEEMIAAKNIVLDEDNDGCYILTQTGKMIVDELAVSLPVSVREKAIKSAETYFQRIKSKQENSVIIKKNKFGYNVLCKVSGGEFNMMELTLYAPDMNTAVTIKDNFYRDPGDVYNSVMNILTSD